MCGPNNGEIGGEQQFLHNSTASFAGDVAMPKILAPNV
jgi:hypothetical protein